MSFTKFLKQLFAGQRDNVKERLADEFYHKLKYRFNDGELLMQALTHRSYVRSNGDSIISNERLEFLGDSVLGLLISEHLFKTCPDFAEGDLTKTKAMLVNENTLSMAGQECGLNDFVYLSDDEEKSGGRVRNSIVSDALEATIGAIYLDGGLSAAREFVHRTIVIHMKNVLSDTEQYNYKGELLEYLQARGERTPYYDVLSENGPDHAKTFEVGVYANGQIVGIGTGLSKKEAEQRAAAEALTKMKEQEDNKEEAQS